jgi:riboflavin synthase
MFSGIIKHLGIVKSVEPEGSNKTFSIQSPLAAALHVDQSISHNGVCLTVESVKEDTYTVTAIKETLEKSNLGLLKQGDQVNLEQSITLQTLLDGHIVQGHVDARAECIEKKEQDGSWLFTFKYPASFRNLVIEKGSIAINGVSLTAFHCEDNFLSVAIIPYTYTHTNFEMLKPGDHVNFEFDILGKYIAKSLIVGR